MRRLLRALPLFAAAAVPANIEKATWTAVTSPHFAAYSDGDPAALVTTVRDLERLRDVLERTTRGLRPDPGVPIVLLGFRTDEEFAAFAGEVQHGFRRVSGYRDPTDGVSYLVLNLAAPDEESDVAHHEFIHVVLGASVPAVPIWFNEGLADYFSTFRAKAKQADIGRPVPYHVTTLAHTELIPVSRLLDVDMFSPEYHEPALMRTLYAESWHLVHMYMQGSEADADAIGRYLTKIRAGDDPHAAFEAAIAPATAADVEARLRRYVEDARFQFTTWKFDTPFEALSPSAVPMKPAEAMFQLGDYLRRSGMHGPRAAAPYFEAALAKDPTHAAALAGRGRVADAAGDTAAAESAYRAALAASGVDLRTRMLVAEGWIARAEKRRPENMAASDSAAPEVRRARALLDPDVAARPDDYALLALYGRSFVGAREDLAFGIDALTSVANAWPQRSDVTLSLVELYGASGNLAAAQAVMASHARGHFDASEQNEAWRAIAFSAEHRADGLVAKRRFAEAESLIAGVHRSCPETNARHYLQFQYDSARIQEAYDMVSGGGSRSKEGVARLKAMLAEPIDDVQRRSIERYLAQIK